MANKYECVEVGHHKNVGKIIEEYQNKGWRLHTYQAAGYGGGPVGYVNHYLLFERGS